MSSWLILGAGGHGRSVADSIIFNGDDVVGFLDDSYSSNAFVSGIPVLGPLSLSYNLHSVSYSTSFKPFDFCLVALGNPLQRQRWQTLLESEDLPLGVLVHPTAYVSPSAILQPGCVLLAGSIVNANVHLHSGVLVNSGAIIDHDAVCGAFSNLGVNAAMSGGSSLAPLAFLKAGEVLHPGEHKSAD